MKNGVEIAAQSGPYPGPFVFQDLCELPDFDGFRPVRRVAGERLAVRSGHPRGFATYHLERLAVRAAPH